MTAGNEITMRNIARNKGTITITILLFIAVTFLVSSVITPKFKSETSILILQKNIDINAYQASKSSEFAGEIMTKIISSSDFMNGVLEKIGKTPRSLGDNPEDQIKNWNDSIRVSSVLNTGIIKITVLEKNQIENKKLTEAIISELQDNGVKYHGNENITLKKISGPVYFEKQAYPNIWLNILVAAVAGLFFSIGWVFVSAGRNPIARFRSLEA
jgi:capsular polysaccharide biosynthesis protein